MLLIIYSYCLLIFDCDSYICALLVAIIFHVGKTEAVIHKDDRLYELQKVKFKVLLDIF